MNATADFATANDSVKTAKRSLTFTLSLPVGTDSRIMLPATPSVAVTVTDDETLGVTGVAVSSTPAMGDTYGAGETISLMVTFNGKVTVTGMPRLAFSLGAVTKQAAYASGSDSTALVFSYMVVASDTGNISWAANALSLNGGTIKFMTTVAADAVAAVLTHAASATPPELSSNPMVDGTALGLTYDQALDTTSVPAASDFTVKVGSTAVSLASSDPVAIVGSEMTLTLAAAVGPTDTVKVSYVVPSSNPLQALDGTDAAALDGSGGDQHHEVVTNTTLSSDRYRSCREHHLPDGASLVGTGQGAGPSSARRSPADEPSPSLGAARKLDTLIATNRGVCRARVR